MNKASTTYQLGLSASRAQGYAAAVAAAAAEAIEELDSTKADKGRYLTASITAANWIKEEIAVDPDAEEAEQDDNPFPYYYDITANIAASDRADVYIATGSMAAARACGFCPMVETMNGKIRVRAQLQPDKDIAVECSITKGVTQ